MKKKKQSESDIQRDICHYLESKDFIFWRFSPETFNAKLGIHIKHRFIPNGLPDIHLLHPGDTKQFPSPCMIGLEVKTPKGRPSAAQLTMQRRFGLANHEYYFVRSVDEVKELGL
jgi:hypothetical protein